MRRPGTGRVLVHPLAVAVLPLPAIVGVLLADGVAFASTCLAVGIVAAVWRSPRFALGVVTTAMVGIAVLWFGFAFSLPAEPQGTPSPVIDGLPLSPTADQAVLALRGALRIVVIMVLYVAAFSFVRWQVLGDTLIERFRVPYRVVDVVTLGGRFAVLIRRDIAAARSLARLRARGRPLRTLRLSSGLVVPVLMAAFRHADELSIAMEARGFGAHPERTVHHAVALRARDGAVVAIVWATTTALAVGLNG